MHDADDGPIRRYLLGLLPEAEADALEEEYFAHSESLERVRGVEDDLLDDWAAGRLPADEKAALEKRYSVSQPLRERLVAARALRQARPLDHARIPVRRSTRWTSAVSIAAGVVLAVVASWIWSRAPQVRTPTPPTSVAGGETPPLPPSPQPTSAASPAASPTLAPRSTRRLVLALSPTLLRGDAGAVEARIPPRSEWLVLHLQLQPSEVEGATALRAMVDTVEGARVWSGPAPQVKEHENLAAEVVVPAGRVPPGDYLVTLSAGSETVHRYFFRVRAP